MYIIESYTFAPGEPGIGTITIPEVLELENFGVITNVTRNSIIYDPAEGKAGASISHVLGDTVLTLEQSTTYCEAGDKLQIAVMPELVSGKVPVDIGTNIDVTIDNTSIEVSNDAGNPIPISDAGGSITVDGTVNTLTGLEIPPHDKIELSYTGDNLTSVVYKDGLSTVATLTLAYTGSRLDSVTRS